MKKLTPAQKEKRARDRKKYKRQHFELVDRGDNCSTPDARKFYYDKAQVAYEKYKAAGGRDWETY